MEVSVTSAQYSALMDIYGPPNNVHDMIMLSRSSGKGQILEGEEEDFDDLLSLISEEIGEGMCNKTNAKRLLAICKKIDPESLDWIGM